MFGTNFLFNDLSTLLSVIISVFAIAIIFGIIYIIYKIIATSAMFVFKKIILPLLILILVLVVGYFLIVAVADTYFGADFWGWTQNWFNSIFN